MTLGEREKALGEVWHVPNAQAVTTRWFVEMVFASVGHAPRLRTAPGWGLALAGLFNPTIRAVREQLYQSERTWVVDSGRFERTFGWAATHTPIAVDRGNDDLVPEAIDSPHELPREAIHMTVLVTYATKHGSTREIAEAIATTLVDRGIPTEALAVNTIADVGLYEAVVLGSAVYMGRWLKEATEFARRHREQLTARPLWLFSSGPLGTDVVDDEEQPKELAELHETLGPREHRVFYGALARDALGFGERMVVKAVKAPEGDFRDWDEIQAWAAAIAGELARDAASQGRDGGS